MNCELVRTIDTYKDMIISELKQSLNDKTKEQIADEVNNIFINIENIISSMPSEEQKYTFNNVVIEIISELRELIIKRCQNDLSALNEYGLENIDDFSGEFFKPLVIIDHIIELLNEKITNTEDELIIEDSGDKVYIFTQGAIRDIEGLPIELYKDIKETIERIYEGNHVGKENRCKIMTDDSFDNSIEHRGNNGIRIYENQVKISNQKKLKKIKSLEEKLGAKVHFIYKVECKKCNSEDGLDKKRKKRYENDRDSMAEFLSNTTPDKFNERKKSAEDKLEELLKEADKTTEEKSNKVIGLLTINKYLHEDISTKIFDGEIDSNINVSPMDEEEFIKLEQCRIHKRILVFLKNKELKDLIKLSLLFEEINETDYSEKTDENLSQNIKKIIIERQRNRIFNILTAVLKKLNINELRKKEREIILLFDYEEEFDTLKKLRERTWGHGQR